MEFTDTMKAELVKLLREHLSIRTDIEYGSYESSNTQTINIEIRLFDEVITADSVGIDMPRPCSCRGCD